MRWVRGFVLPLVIGSYMTASASLQQPSVEYGSQDELSGVTKVFVDTGLDQQSWGTIVKEVQKKLPALVVVSKPGETDIHLKFSRGYETEYVFGTPRPGPVKIGVGTVVKVLNGDCVRVLMDYQEPRLGIKFGKRNPAADFAKKFVNAYLQANGKK